MKQIFEDMIVIVLIIIGVLVNTCMIKANLEITEARNYHAQAIEEIQASGFSTNVITDKQAEAQEHGWELIVSDNLSPYEDRQDRKVTLVYTITPLPIVGTEQERNIVGYAR
ncbi:hypothetical protein [Massilimicrobiota timonensis]|uniref:hypothetical protein n=1 Tax=Massilimicrobiota timonensis TaxID=1776392 RepID=UPI00101B972B|nr:hypothetical protein [Massilimicrobiota timonensis]